MMTRGNEIELDCAQLVYTRRSFALQKNHSSIDADCRTGIPASSGIRRSRSGLARVMSDLSEEAESDEL